MGTYSAECACKLRNSNFWTNTTTPVILIARTLALYNFHPRVIALMCVLAVVLVVSSDIVPIPLRSPQVIAISLS